MWNLQPSLERTSLPRKGVQPVPIALSPNVSRRRRALVSCPPPLPRFERDFVRGGSD